MLGPSNGEDFNDIELARLWTVREIRLGVHIVRAPTNCNALSKRFAKVLEAVPPARDRNEGSLSRQAAREVWRERRQ
jgi:hypothetical protein